jgi:hypothetical protein
MTGLYIKCSSFYSAELLLCSSIISEYIGVFVLPWHKIKNSIVIGIRLLHFQPLMNSNCYFLIIVELETVLSVFSGPNNAV